jgi:hypothetical protein
MNTEILSVYIIAIAFLFWFGLSIFRQLPGKHSHPIFRYDFLSLIPIWKLFVSPIEKDFHLLYRDRFKGGDKMTDWHLVSPYRRYKFVGAIWNPTQLFDKSKFDLITKLALSTANVQDLSKLEETMPYQTILNYVMQLPRSYDIGKEEFDTQFMIMTTSGIIAEEPPRTVFVSAFHHHYKQN